MINEDKNLFLKYFYAVQIPKAQLKYSSGQLSSYCPREKSQNRTAQCMLISK